MFNVALISLGKAFKSLGILVAAAGAAVIADPEVVTPLFAAIGPYGVVAVIGINLAGSALLDALKHRNDLDEE